MNTNTNSRSLPFCLTPAGVAALPALLEKNGFTGMWDGQRHHYPLKGAQTDFADPAGRPLPQIGLPLANIAQQGTPTEPSSPTTARRNRADTSAIWACFPNKASHGWIIFRQFLSGQIHLMWEQR